MLPLPLPFPTGDGSGTVAGRPVLPETRGECQDGPRPCPHLLCRHHILGELARLSRRHPERAIRAIVDRLESGDVPTCALDVADDGPQSDERVSRLLGIDAGRVGQVASEAGHRVRLEMSGAERSHGERAPRSPLTDERRRRIVDLHRQGMSERSISDRVGCSIKRVREVLDGDPLFDKWSKKHEVEDSEHK